MFFLKMKDSPDWEDQLVRASCQYTKVVGLIPSQGTKKNQP